MFKDYTVVGYKNHITDPNKRNRIFVAWLGKLQDPKGWHSAAQKK